MKAVCSFFLTLFCFNAFSAKAQINDSAFVFLANQFDKQWTINQFKITGEVSAGSNTLNTAMFSDFLFRNSFSDRAKNAFLETSDIQTNLGFGLNAGAEIKLSKKWGIYTANKQQSYFTLGNSLSKLLLFGNARFADKTVTSENAEILQASTAEIGLTHNTYNTEKWQIKTSLGISSLYNYAYYSADLVELYTAVDGSYLDFKTQNAVWVDKRISKTGLGINAGFDVSYSPSVNHNIVLRVCDITIFNVPNGSQYTLDTAFRFEGINYVFDNDNDELQLTADSAFDGVLNSSKVSKIFLTLPSSVALRWSFAIDEKNQVGFSGQTTGIGKFGTLVGVNHDYTFSNKLRLRSGINFGDFIGLQWNQAVEWKIKKTNVYLTGIGLNALVVPLQSHSYGFTAGISKLF